MFSIFGIRMLHCTNAYLFYSRNIFVLSRKKLERKFRMRTYPLTIVNAPLKEKL